MLLASAVNTPPISRLLFFVAFYLNSTPLQKNLKIDYIRLLKNKMLHYIVVVTRQLDLGMVER